MTQVASAATVLAPFDNVQLSSRGRDYYLTREGDKFFVTMADPDWKRGSSQRTGPGQSQATDRQTRGSDDHWLASHARLLDSEPGLEHASSSSFRYLLADKRWVPREDIFITPPDAERHLAVWNDNCLVCHAVAGNPNFDLRSIKVATEVAELGISAKRATGPAKLTSIFTTAKRRKSRSRPHHQSSQVPATDRLRDLWTMS